MILSHRRWLDFLRSWGLSKRKKQPANRFARLGFERLEDRTTPATASGIITGTAFVDSNANGIFDNGEFRLPGVSVQLTGTVNFVSPGDSANVDVSTTTDANGNYTFNNVLPGTYSVHIGGVSYLTDTNGVSNVSSATEGVSVVSSETASKSLGVQGSLAPTQLSLLAFLNTATSTNYSIGLPGVTPGLGQANANFRANNKPTATTISDITAAGTKTIDLAGVFSDADFTNSLIRIDTTDGPINVELLDTSAPQTVANFFDYIKAGTYNGSIFHRLVNGFVLQGGSFAFNSTTSTIDAVAQGPKIPNEFKSANSNVIGTLAMAQVGSNSDSKDSATNGFFFNIANNDGTGANNLNTLNGGFAVFGKVVNPSDLDVVNSLAATSVDTSHSSPFNEIPLRNYSGSSFPTDTTAANYIGITNIAIIKRDEFLTYTVSSDNTSVATVSLDPAHNEMLTVVATGVFGTANITVTAKDRYGASFSTTFKVNADKAPTITSNGGGDTATIAVPENSTAVTTVQATDADSGQTVTYSIVGGDDRDKFAINTNTGVLTFKTAPDFENPTDTGTNNSYQVQVQASDGVGGTDVQTITVNVTNLPISIAGGASTSVNVTSDGVTSSVKTVSVTSGETVTYSIDSGGDSVLFTIDPNTGVLSFVSPPPLNTDTTYEITVRATDTVSTEFATQDLNVVVQPPGP